MRKTKESSSVLRTGTASEELRPETGLLPCPFCGRKAEIWSKATASATYVSCWACKVGPVRVEDWNTRVPLKKLMGLFVTNKADNVHEKAH